MSHRLTDEERDLALTPERRLSRIPAGHWRCKFCLRAGLSAVLASDGGPADAIVVDERTWISPPRYVSREIADESAAYWMRNDPTFDYATYLGAVFFPGEPA